MTTFEAVMTIVNDQYIRRRRAVDYRRMKRALTALGLNDSEQDAILMRSEYHSEPNEPYEWAIR